MNPSKLNDRTPYKQIANRVWWFLGNPVRSWMTYDFLLLLCIAKTIGTVASEWTVLKAIAILLYVVNY
jgi:glucuronate isomerase